MTWEDEEIERMVENLSRVCKCNHSLVCHEFNNNNPSTFWCKLCKCKQFRQMSNMEWLVYQAEQRLWYVRLRGWFSYLIYRTCKQIKKFFV